MRTMNLMVEDPSHRMRRVKGALERQAAYHGCTVEEFTVETRCVHWQAVRIAG